MIVQATPASIKVRLKDRGGRTTVAEGVGHVHVRVLRILGSLIALEAPVLSVSVHPGNIPPLAMWEDVTYLIRVLARLDLDMPSRAVP
jgi:hypothetical protein